MIGGIIGLLLIIGAIVLTVQFIKVNTGNKVYPYQDEDHQELIIDPVFVEYKDFQLFDVKLEAVSMDTFVCLSNPLMTVRLIGVSSTTRIFFLVLSLFCVS